VSAKRLRVAKKILARIAAAILEAVVLCISLVIARLAPKTAQSRSA
jgi:hypothetical protein